MLLHVGHLIQKNTFGSYEKSSKRPLLIPEEIRFHFLPRTKPFRLSIPVKITDVGDQTAIAFGNVSVILILMLDVGPGL